MIKVFTDGACTSSGTHKGLGGWSFVMFDTDGRSEFEHTGGSTDTTNNRMEMEAVIQALKHIVQTKHLYESDSKILFYSDSNLVVETLKKDGSWQKKSNIDKWEEIDELVTLLITLGFDIDFTWVKAHDDKSEVESARFNKRADKLATKARDAMKELGLTQSHVLL
ncbi:ribonuclease H family protein [Paenibacillus chitinolyticus]|uniref:ribonuclease H family protein n=1 Tax=Paenibacillus chitinolyticus TaxID=79263 RepID=UPI003D03941D